MPSSQMVDWREHSVASRVVVVSIVAGDSVRLIFDVGAGIDVDED